MLENYLLHAAAIRASLLELGEDVQEDVVRGKLLQKRAESQAARGGSVHGALVLAHTYSDLSEARPEFRKTRDVPTLVEWLLSHEPAHLAPLREEIRSLFLPH
jgi:hypothetical protein